MSVFFLYRLDIQFSICACLFPFWNIVYPPNKWEVKFLIPFDLWTFG